MSKVYRVQVLVYSLFLCILLSTVHCTLYPSYALEATPSSEASIKSKLDQLKADIASKAAQIKNQVNQKLQNKAYIGTVSELSKTNLSLLTKDGTKKIILTEDTIYQSLNPKVKLSTFGGLKKEATVAALGDLDENDVLTAGKIVLLGPPNKPKVHLIGKAIAVTSSTLNLETKDGSVTITFDEDTIMPEGDIEIGSNLIISALPEKSNTLLASLIFAISGESAASPSASPK